LHEIVARIVDGGARGIEVAGAELVGLMPVGALPAAGAALRIGASMPARPEVGCSATDTRFPEETAGACHATSGHVSCRVSGTPGASGKRRLRS
jgi:hypothetical protein